MFGLAYATRKNTCGNVGDRLRSFRRYTKFVVTPDMDPVVGSLEMEERLEREARVAVAGAQKAIDDVSVSFISTRSGKSEEMQLSEVMGMAQAKYEAAVAT